MAAWLDGDTIVATLVDEVCQPDITRVHRICGNS